MTRSVDTALALYLARLRLRSPLGRDEQEAILGLSAHAQIADVQRDFVRIGDRIDHACLVVDGLVARFAQLRNGSRGFVALHIPGDMADLHSVVAPQVSWALHALTPTRILRIPHEVLRRTTDRYPALATAFWRDCVVDGNVIAQWMVNTARKDALARVTHLFAELDMRYTAIGLKQGNTYPLPVTQNDLSDAVALTPVHLNRILRRLRDEGIAAKSGAAVTIYDDVALARLGEFDPAYLQLVADTRGKSH